VIFLYLRLSILNFNPNTHCFKATTKSDGFRLKRATTISGPAKGGIYFALSSKPIENYFFDGKPLKQKSLL
jgi:hypothetical protein